MYTREEVNSPILLFGCQVYLSLFLFAFLSYYFLCILCARIVLSFTLLKSFIKIMLPEFVKYCCYIYSIHAINKDSLSLSLSPSASTPFDWNNNACDDLSGLSHVT